MNTPIQPRPSDRDRAIRVLRGLTLGVAIGGLAGTGAIGVLAAQSYAGTTGTIDPTAADATSRPDAQVAAADPAATAIPTAAASTTAAAGVSTSNTTAMGTPTPTAATTPTPTAAPTATSVRGGGHVTTGGS